MLNPHASPSDPVSELLRAAGLPLSTNPSFQPEALANFLRMRAMQQGGSVNPQSDSRNPFGGGVPSHFMPSPYHHQ